MRRRVAFLLLCGGLVATAGLVRPTNVDSYTQISPGAPVVFRTQPLP